MNFLNHYFILWRFLFILFLAGQAPAQSLFPTEWKFELLKDESAEWWNTLRVNMIPGVSYTLQKSEHLISWQNLYSQYGTDGEWICPLYKGVAPSLPSTNAPLQIAGIRPRATQYVWLVLQKDQTGAALISWNSLDDHSPKQTRLTAITLDPVWKEYDNFYLNQHNNHLFSISPMVYSAVTYTATAPILGTKDTAMLAALIASFPVITENIQHSVDVAAAYTPTPSNSSSGDRGFFRVAADWTLDSDGDGIYDWHELIFDGSNPFLMDTDGDGQIDTIQDNSGPEPTLDNSTRNSSTATALQPKAIIERNRIYAHRLVIHKPNDPSYTQGPQIFSQAYSEASSLINKSSYSAFAEGVGNLNLLEGEWIEWLLRFGSSHIKTEPITGSTDPKLNGAYSESFSVERSAYRIRLEEPAPEGGYTIKLRIVSYRWSLDSNGGSRDGPIRNMTYEDLELKVAAGETLGISKMAASPDLSPNEQVTTIPIYLEANSYEIDSSQNEVPTESPEGVCTVPSLGFRAHLEGYWPFSDTNEITITWQNRRLRGNNTLGEWQGMTPEMSYSELSNPPSNLDWRGYAYLTIQDPGIFQLQALLNFPDGTQVSIPFLRMRNAKSIKNGKNVSNSLLTAGQPDYVGVCRNQLSLNVRNEAIKWLGSTKYAYEANVPIQGGNVFNSSTKDRPKCNLFVTHLSNRMGATTPYYYRRLVQPTAPIAKDDWYANPEKNIDLDGPGWLYRGVSLEPSPGMVVASPRTSSGTGFGHVGFLDYDGSWINAGSLTVNKSLHLLDPSNEYKPNTFRGR